MACIVLYFDIRAVSQDEIDAVCNSGGVETERAAPSNQKESRGDLRVVSTSGAPGFENKEARAPLWRSGVSVACSLVYTQLTPFILAPWCLCAQMHAVKCQWVCQLSAVAEAAAVCFAMCSQCTFRFRLLQTHWIDPAGWKKRESATCRWNVTRSGHGCRSHTCL